MKMWKTYKDNDADNDRQQTNDQKCSHESLAGSGELKCIVHVFDLDNTLQFQARHCYIFCCSLGNEILACKSNYFMQDMSFHKLFCFYLFFF